jgi:hypothetical protein
MSKIKLGDAMAYLGPGNYVKVGALFAESDNPDRMTLKLDAVPLPNVKWDGWINIWTEKPKPAARVESAPKVPIDPSDTPLDDDTPF